MSAIGILGGLAAAGAAYKEGQRNKKREERLERYEDALTDLRSEQAKRLRSGGKPEVVVVKDGVADMSTLGMPGSYQQQDAQPELLNSVKEEERVDGLARGGVVGYSHGGYVGNVMDCSDSSWQRQSFKK